MEVDGKTSHCMSKIKKSSLGHLQNMSFVEFIQMVVVEIEKKIF